MTMPEVVKSRYKLSDEEYLAEIERMRGGLQRSIRGKTARDKGNSFERRVATFMSKLLQCAIVRTPMSGGFHKDKASNMKGDLTVLTPNVDISLHVECKNHRELRIREWIKQAEEDANKGDVPIVVFHKHQKIDSGKVVDSAGDYVIIGLEDFTRIVDGTKLVHRRRLRRK